MAAKKYPAHVNLVMLIYPLCWEHPPTIQKKLYFLWCDKKACSTSLCLVSSSTGPNAFWPFTELISTCQGMKDALNATHQTNYTLWLNEPPCWPQSVAVTQTTLSERMVRLSTQTQLEAQLLSPKTCTLRSASEDTIIIAMESKG